MEGISVVEGAVSHWVLLLHVGTREAEPLPRVLELLVGLERDPDCTAVEDKTNQHKYQSKGAIDSSNEGVVGLG